MAPLDGEVAARRGMKRKHSGDEVRLTPFQRLAAARRVENAARLAEEAAWELSKDDPANNAASDTEELQSSAEDGRDDAYYRKLYETEPDFRSLGEKDADFLACLKDGRHLDFTDPASVMQLTKTLLKLDFGLQVDLPSDRLCPPVPNRHNYILWLKNLIDSTSSSYSDIYEPGRQVTGLDIGTGASAIYPLLGGIQRPWNFIATDIDDESLCYARKNVEMNHLQSQIQVFERPVEDLLIPLDELKLKELDFVMTNPPFYTSESELLELAKQKSQPPNSVCTGALNEMVCDGGEVGFIKRILDESLVLRERIQWYTSMLGKQSSLEVVVGLLKEKGIENYAVTEFFPGNKTRRWAIGWSFGNRRSCLEACRGFEPAAGKKLLPPPTEFSVATKMTRKGGREQLENVFWTQLEDVTDGLDLVSWNMDEDRLRVVGFANGNVWSRAYRRSKERHSVKREDSVGRGANKTVAECAFGFAISIRTEKGQAIQDKVEVVVRWLQGTDYGLFESFYGMLRNALLNVVV